MTPQKTLNYRSAVEKEIKRLCGSVVLANSLVKINQVFIDTALERGRPAERVANSIYISHTSTRK